MAFVVIATVEPPSGEVIREALAEAGIEVHLVEVRLANPWMLHQLSATLDVQVPAEQEEKARGVLAQLHLDASDAVLAQASTGEGAGRKSDDDLRREREAKQLDPARSRVTAFLLGLFIPVAGPIYAGSMRYTLISLALHGITVLTWMAGAPGGWSTFGWTMGALYVFIAARIFDVVVSQLVIARHGAHPNEESDGTRS
jgi:hypothetical protein